MLNARSIWKNFGVFQHVVCCDIKFVFFLTVYVFGSCFRTLAVTLVSDLSTAGEYAGGEVGLCLSKPVLYS